MNIEELREFCVMMEGVVEKTPFGKFARRYESILVFYVCGHIFCLVDMDDFTSVTVKSTPDEIDELRQCHSAVTAPSNFSPRHWMQLNLGGDFSDSRIFSLIARSYEIVKAKYTPRARRK